MRKKHRVKSTDPMTLSNYKVINNRVSTKTQEHINTCASDFALDIILKAGADGADNISSSTAESIQ
jgi:hypothetical protein